MKSLSTSMDRFGDNLCKALTGDPSQKTPQRHTRAVTQAQQEDDWLDLDDCLILCNIVERDIKAADAYIALNPDNIPFRQRWIRSKIHEAKMAAIS